MTGSTRAPALLLCIALLIGIPLSALAADTGTASGVVLDQRGEVVADATVRISGDGVPSGRVAQTGANGWYRFEHLLPGAYTIEVDKAGTGAFRRSARVDVAKDTQVDIVLGLAITEAVTVTLARPEVDVRSTEVSFNFSADTFNSLPLERTYRGLLQLIPGVADNRSAIGPAAGGGRQDNTYLIDGANITNPGFGYLSADVNELDIADVNLKRAGITAEFGRTAGSVTNAVSRRGSNRLAGIGRIDWLPTRLVSAYALPDDLLALGVKPGAFRDPQLTGERQSAVGIGGPILQDRLFYYGSARYFRETKWNRVNKVAMRLPNEVRETEELYGKLTGVPTASQQLNAGYRYRPSHVDHAGLDSNAAPGVATESDNGSRIGSADWASFMTASSSVSVRYLYMRENNEDVPLSHLQYLPVFNSANLAAMGQYTDPAQADLKVGGSQYTNTQNYRRHEARGTFTQFLDIGRSSHAVKAGGGYEFSEEALNRVTNGWGLITHITQADIPALRARYYTRQTPQRGQGHTYSLFVQDDVTVANRVTLNAGVLLNRDEFSQDIPGSGGCPSTITLKGGAAVYESHGDTCTFLRFGIGDEIQPRLGMSYQVRAGRGDKVYANWGRYYNMDQKSAGRSLAPTRIFQTQTVFGLRGAVLSSGPLASTTGKMIDPALEPIFTDEILVGYATPIGEAFSLDVFFMSRAMNNFIEDVPSRLGGTAPDSGPFVAVNLPCVAIAACRSADATRTYRAFTIDVRRRLAQNWMSDVSYTWSRFEGNFDLDYSQAAVFNTSSFIQDAPGTNVEDPNRFGPLLEDRPHVFKAFTTYAVTSRVTLSGYLRAQSGAPWTARGRDWAGAQMNYLEPAGSHRNPAWANLDLMAAYQLPLGGRARVSVEARVLNVLDDQTRLSTDSLQYLDLRTVAAPPYFAPYQQPNPFFSTGNGFAPPRRLHLSAVVSF